MRIKSGSSVRLSTFVLLWEFADIICVLESSDPASGATSDDDLLRFGE